MNIVLTFNDVSRTVSESHHQIRRFKHNLWSEILRKELKESKEVNGVSIVTVISWIMCTLARDTAIRGCPFSFR